MDINEVADKTIAYLKSAEGKRKWDENKYALGLSPMQNVFVCTLAANPEVTELTGEDVDFICAAVIKEI